MPCEALEASSEVLLQRLWHGYGEVLEEERRVQIGSSRRLVKRVASPLVLVTFSCTNKRNETWKGNATTCARPPPSQNILNLQKKFFRV